jgi:hypothetical protein
MNNSQANSHRKKGVLVIKKESINRQNSFSRSPTNQEMDPNMHENSMGSPYNSPKILNS